MFRKMLVVVALTTMAATTAAAQRPNTREGFWIGLGVGPGSVAAECNTCDEDNRKSDFSGYFRAGGTVSRHVQLGGELLGWASGSTGDEQGLGIASFVALIYPSAEGAFFLKFGLGGMTYAEDFGANELAARAPGLSLGLGYDFRVANNFALTPFLNAFASAPVSFRINDVPVPSGQEIRINFVQFGLGFHWF
jgi:hypothetical protein